MANDINTGKKLKLIETDDINKVPFEEGQYIIVDDGMVYYDPTTGISLEDRICLTPKYEVDTYERTNDRPDEYYLALQTKPIIGDLVIIKDLIPKTNKYTYTIYIYNNNEEDTNITEWCKLTGSYTTDNVFFDKDITITLPLEGIDLVDGRKTIASTGKNITEVMDAIFSPEKNPTITQPSMILSFPQSGDYEIGTTITPTYELNLDPGKYEYGPETGVIANSYRVISSNNVTKTTRTGNFSTFTITESTDFYINASITHSSGTIPLTAKENEYATGQITANTITMESKHITGYINGLYYGCSNEIKSVDNITSTFMKSLNKTGKAYTAESVDMIVPVGTKSIIIACPVNSNGISKIYNNTVNCDMTEAFGAPVTIKINGNSESSTYARNYNVWIYTPAEPYEIAAKLTITTL